MAFHGQKDPVRSKKLILSVSTAHEEKFKLSRKGILGKWLFKWGFKDEV